MDLCRRYIPTDLETELFPSVYITDEKIPSVYITDGKIPSVIPLLFSVGNSVVFLRFSGSVKCFRTGREIL